jgi:hypothetical protein
MQPRAQVALVTLVALVALVLVAVNGHRAYRFYEGLSAENEASETAPASQTPASETPAPKTTKAGTAQPGAQTDPTATDIVQHADTSNVDANSTYVDDLLTNGNPDAMLLVTRARGPDNAGFYAHEIGVWYDRYRDGGRWAIFNQDRAPMQEGSTFDVALLEEPSGFVHRATSANTEGSRTYVDEPQINGKPDAVVSITQNWNPGGGSGVYNDHRVGVSFDAGRGRWTILNEDGAPIPDGAAFNVAVAEGSPPG